MSGLPWLELEALFHDTLARPVSERDAFLAARCEGRPDLRAQIESLVDAHERSGGAETAGRPPRSRLTPGTVIGAYEIVGEIATGGMGAVYRARDTRLNRTVALKMIRGDLQERASLRERFRREAELIGGLNHPNICTLHDVVSTGDEDYLVMELVDGETLASRLERGPLPVRDAIRRGHEIADAIGRAHRSGIAHRDLKPANILMTSTGAKLLDFCPKGGRGDGMFAAEAPASHKGTSVCRVADGRKLVE